MSLSRLEQRCSELVYLSFGIRHISGMANEVVLAYSKLVIGPIMLVAEQPFGGYALEGLKIRRQALGLPYCAMVKDILRRQGFRGLYYGYFPWALLQSLQGIPMLFTQHHVERFINGFGLSSNMSAALGGMAGGITMAFVVTPTSRLKTIAMTDPNFRGMNATSVLIRTVHNNGLSSIYNGFVPWCLKKSVDWSVRFGVADWLSVAGSSLSGKHPDKFGVSEKFLVGAAAGAASTVISTPIDVLVANAQKFRESGRRAGLFELVFDLYRESGLRGFYRGWSMRVVHATYHTAWLYGGGKALFDWLNAKHTG